MRNKRWKWVVGGGALLMIHAIPLSVLIPGTSTRTHTHAHVNKCTSPHALAHAHVHTHSCKRHWCLCFSKKKCTLHYIIFRYSLFSLSVSSTLFAIFIRDKNSLSLAVGSLFAFRSLCCKKKCRIPARNPIILCTLLAPSAMRCCVLSEAIRRSKTACMTGISNSVRRVRKKMVKNNVLWASKDENSTT